ncbi:MAG: hypothetical protein WBB48_09110 [Thermodesulfobacteriota bacterium]
MKSITKPFQNFSRLCALVLILGFIVIGSIGGCNNDNSGGDDNGGGFGGAPAAIFSGGQFGVDYSWTSVSRCRNNRDISMDGCDVNAAFENIPSAPMPACTGSANPFCTLDECVACYEVDTTQMKSVGADIIRLYSPNYSVTEAASKQGVKVVVGTENATISMLASDATFAATFLKGQYSPYITPLEPHIKDGTIVGIILGNEVNGSFGCAPCSPALLGMAATNLRTALNAITGGSNVKIATTLVGIPTSPTTPTAEEYCNSSDIDAVGFDLYCPLKGQSPPGGTTVCTGKNVPAGCNTPPQCVDVSITGWYEMNTPTACLGKSFIAETGYTTGDTNNPGSNLTSLYPDLTTMLDTYKTWACTNQIQSFYFEWFDEDETNINAPNKFFGIYEWTTTAATQNYPMAKYQDEVSKLFTCP